MTFVVFRQKHRSESCSLIMSQWRPGKRPVEKSCPQSHLLYISEGIRHWQAPWCITNTKFCSSDYRSLRNVIVVFSCQISTIQYDRKPSVQEASTRYTEWKNTDGQNTVSIRGPRGEKRKETQNTECESLENAEWIWRINEYVKGASVCMKTHFCPQTLHVYHCRKFTQEVICENLCWLGF